MDADMLAEFRGEDEAAWQLVRETIDDDDASPREKALAGCVLELAQRVLLLLERIDRK